MENTNNPIAENNYSPGAVTINPKKSFGYKDLILIVPVAIIIGFVTKNYLITVSLIVFAIAYAASKSFKGAWLGVTIEADDTLSVGVNSIQLSDMGINAPPSIQDINKVSLGVFPVNNLTLEIACADGKVRNLRIATRPFSKESIITLLNTLRERNKKIYFDEKLLKKYS